MMAKITRFAGLLCVAIISTTVAAALSGCGETEGDARGREQAGATAPAGHENRDHGDESAGAAHGAGADAAIPVALASASDWCRGHGVPESLCTRCNPALIATFKESGDWCAGHGLPESQCLICNPSYRQTSEDQPPRASSAE